MVSRRLAGCGFGHLAEHNRWQASAFSVSMRSVVRATQSIDRSRRSACPWVWAAVAGCAGSDLITSEV